MTREPRPGRRDMWPVLDSQRASSRRRSRAARAAQQSVTFHSGRQRARHMTEPLAPFAGNPARRSRWLRRIGSRTTVVTVWLVAAAVGALVHRILFAAFLVICSVLLVVSGIRDRRRRTRP